MRKVQSLRRQGVLLGMLILGTLLGRFGTDVAVSIVAGIFIIWLLAYDFATEGRLRDVSSERGRNSANLR